MKHVSLKSCKFILCCVKWCKWKNKYIYIVLDGPIKQCKCKKHIFILFYMAMQKNVKNMIFIWGGEIS
jgi:hypothetical protein